MIIAVLSMLMGAGRAIMQADIILMAYSSIAHMGYALVGVAAAGDLGVASVMLLQCMSFLLLVFYCLSLKQEGRPLAVKIYGFSVASGLCSVMVLMFSIADTTNGWVFGKWFVFSAAIASGHVILAVIGVLASVIGAFYYIRIIKVMYVDEQIITIDNDIPEATMIALGAAVVMAFLFGLGMLRDELASCPLSSL